MKKTIFLLLTLTFLFCKKESLFDSHGFYGEGSAKINGEDWKGKTGVFDAGKYCKTDSCFSIVMYKYNEFGQLKGKIVIGRIALKVGKFQFNPEPVYNDTSYTISFGEYHVDDVASTPHRLFEADPNCYFEIKELNKETGDISGTFRAKLVRKDIDPSIFDGKYPYTITIEDGNFFGNINWDR